MSSAQKPNVYSSDSAVMERYSAAAGARAEALCCPVEYDPRYLAIIPQEILERDYGCGDPSSFVRKGDTVLDLGSGGGKIAYICAQIVGPAGKVIGVDFNLDMLALARKHQAGVAQRIGYDIVKFHRARIQDLALDLDALDAELRRNPIQNADEFLRVERECARMRREAALVADNSVDIVLSNCVLNLVEETDKRILFAEIFRAVKDGGRIAISDVVSDKPVPAEMKRDPELWSGCISGAFEESAFIRAFADAGFEGLALAKRDSKPWRTVNGIEFRAVTVVAHKGQAGETDTNTKDTACCGPKCC